jgi:uncharacterized protein (UPF0371 family)
MEIIRRYYDCRCKAIKGTGDGEDAYKTEIIMNKAKTTVEDRPVVQAAQCKAAKTDAPAAAIELPDGTIVTGRTSNLLGACSAAILNALKTLAGIDDDVHLISPSVIEPICRLKTDHLGSVNPRLHVDEILIALSICAATDPNARAAFECLPQLSGCEAHSSVIISQIDLDTFRRLGFTLTCEPVYESKKLFHR